MNWPVVELADAAVLLVADIDRGGVFAQVIGTLDLLAPEERQRVCGIVINRFRGDRALFADGVRFLEERTGIPVWGVVPFAPGLALDQEDGLEDQLRRPVEFSSHQVNIAVVLLPHMSNFTDFNALGAEQDVVLRYASSPSQLIGADVAILPGSKNTLADLDYLREKEFAQALAAHVRNGKEVVGICGGYQMLGQKISDPHQVEMGGVMCGLGYLDTTTELSRHKRTIQVAASPLDLKESEGVTVRGYEIHMGATLRGNVRPCFRIQRLGAGLENISQRDGEQEESLDGAVSMDGLVWGTYIHGLYDQPNFRRMWLNRVRVRKGLCPLAVQVSEATTRQLAGELDRWAGHVEAHLDVKSLFKELHRTG